MKFVEFTIKNFKGIEDITFNLDKSPEANIYTLVGLNESGKTTILEAINLFNGNNKGLGALDIPGSTIKDFNVLIPISLRDNFNGRITIEAKLKTEKGDFDEINDYIKLETPFKKIKQSETFIYFSNFDFENSKFIKQDPRWSGCEGILKDDATNQYIDINQDNYPEVNLKLARLCRKKIPSILYFPNFLFDFPSKLFLEADSTANPKDVFYLELVQDILYSLKNELDIKTHLVNRIKSEDKADKRNLDRVIQRMEIQITDVIFNAWKRIFQREVMDTRVAINYDIDEDNRAYLEFQLESPDGIYQINERSLGFKWFFIFLLFTQFRPFRQKSPQNVIFLFDEPASNLHSTAQKQLLKSFENLIDNCKVIYTTHSHHLINPKWLESTYVVRNEGLNINNSDSYNIKQTKISIQSYREFATNHPHNTAYFQPILDVLDYSPSNLENLPNCVFLEGKNDFYTLSYFSEIVLGDDEKINLAPSTSSGNLDTLISLYIGWGKKFVILLDSDATGKKERKRYIERYGILVEENIYDLSDVNKDWEKMEIEKLFTSDEQLIFQQTAYPDSKKFNKTHFNRAIQESLIKRKSFEFSDETKKSFKLILDFLKGKLK